MPRQAGTTARTGGASAGRVPAVRALAGSVAGAATLGPLVDAVLDGLASGAEQRAGPLPAGGPGAVAAAVDAWWNGADSGGGAAQRAHDPVTVLATLARTLAAGAADPADPACAGHLHTPPLALAVAADLAVAGLNQSLDSWDQAPAAVVVEERVLDAVGRVVGFAAPDGVMTTGATEANLMALLLARDAVVDEQFGVRVRAAGMPAEAAGRLRVLCSEVAHFSVDRAAGLLGLGEDAVVRVPVDRQQRMDVAALGRALDTLHAHGRIPVLVVATAGTTDTGAIDPLRPIVAAAHAAGVRVHVDAAYGGGALFSAAAAPLLDGIADADYVALDLHKLGWQPAPAGFFLVRDTDAFRPLARTVSYLNPPDDEAAGYLSRLGRSLRTTRRADAVPVAATLRALGPAGLGQMVDRCCALARYGADAVRRHPRLELAVEPQLTSLVFRYRPQETGAAASRTPCQVNAALRRRLLSAGTAVLGRATLAGSPAVWLKLTLLNPHATPADVDRLLALVAAAGEREECP